MSIFTMTGSNNYVQSLFKCAVVLCVVSLRYHGGYSDKYRGYGWVSF